MFKNISMFLMASTLTVSALATTVIKKGEAILDYTCKERNVANPRQYTVNLVAQKDYEFAQNNLMRSTLTVKLVAVPGQEVLIKPKIFNGLYSFRDVENTFIDLSDVTSAKLTLYTDELDQTVFEYIYNGAKIVRKLDCN